MRVGIYARVSTEAQEARGTIGSQLEALRERVEVDGDQLVAEYVDDGVSGARLDRPGLDALRDAAEAGVIEAVWCLTPDRLSRSYAYQVLITDELARHGVSVRYLDAPHIDSDPQARLLIQIQSVIAEYERAKISERSRRGKLFRARAGEAVHWRAPYGYVRVPRQAERPAHLVINEAQAGVVRRIFADYTTGALSLRKIRQALDAEHVPTINGARSWDTGTIGRILRREAYVGRAQVNRTKMIESGPGARPRQVARPKDEWIAIPCPAIIDEATFAAAARACAENTNFSARRLNPDEQGWLLRGLVFCACGTRSIVDRGRSSQPEGIRYYACRNRKGIAGVEPSCHVGNVRAEALDNFVFAQTKQALLTPELLLAGEQAVTARQPMPDDQLLAAELTRLDRRIDTTNTERRRLADLYQTGVIEPAELARRATEIDERRQRFSNQRDELIAQRRQLTNTNRLRDRLDSFAARVTETADQLNFQQRQRLIRILVERVQVRGWQVDIHLRIPLEDPPPDTTQRNPPEAPHPTGNAKPTPVSSEDRLRSVGHGEGVRVVQVVGVELVAGQFLGAAVGEAGGEAPVAHADHRGLLAGDPPAGARGEEHH
ncbi:MAG: recombinase family protein, partial [Actinobacteria bacterium]|nr:recombinase family protein [Actinomycetota bacterium]